MDKEKTIIFAEPTDALYSGLNQYINERGYHTIRAVNLKETLLTLQGKKVDVLVLDAALLEEDCGFISVIKGMVKAPVETVLAIALPETEPKNAEAITATLAGPPVLRPANASGKSIKNFPAPDLCRKAPKKIKRIT